jgi:hypothetical protein
VKLDDRLAAAPSDSDLSWIEDGVRPFGEGVVGTLVPVRFEAYGRILHPAWRADGSAIRWDVVSAWSGRTVHSQAEFTRVASPVNRTSDPAPFRQPPRDGALPRETLNALKDVLRRHTTALDAVFVGIWEGVGWIEPGQQQAPRLRLPERSHLVFQGDADVLDHVGWVGFDGRLVHEAPNVIWPAGRSWFVASDIDQESTYVGGSKALIEALIADPSLEVWQAAATDSITAGSDAINR